MQKKCIILTDGKAGHENQTKAFARGIGCEAAVVRVEFRSRFAKALSYALDFFGVRTLRLFKPFKLPKGFARGEAAIVAGAGSGTFYAVKALAKKLGAKAAAVLTPAGYRAGSFDCILSPAFDRAPRRPNTIEIPVNLVASDEEFYACGVAAFRARHPSAATAKAPVAFIIGGPNKCSTLTAEWMRARLAEAFAATEGRERWVTTSRRTPKDVEDVIDSFPFDYKLIYSRDQFNPIPAFVMLASRLYVTAESTGMLSEACSRGSAEVIALDNLAPGRHKFRRFIDSLAAGGYIGGARKVDLSEAFARAKALLA